MLANPNTVIIPYYACSAVSLKRVLLDQVKEDSELGLLHVEKALLTWCRIPRS